jgi:NADH-quinone oxidoreductase subunit C
MTEQLLSALFERFYGLRKEQPPEGEFRDGVPVLMVPPKQLTALCRLLREDGDYAFDLLKNLTAVDYPDHLTVVYHLYSIEKRHKVALKVEIGRENPSLDTVTGVWAAADWQEREVFDLFGIRFNGHPDLRRIMLPQDWAGHPLRKDYVHQPDQYD